MGWLALIAAADQITVIVTESLLFRPLRERVARSSHYLGELVSCFLCFGTWVGLALSLVARRPAGVGRRRRGTDAIVAWAIDGFAIAFGARLLNEVTGKLQREVKVLDETVDRLEESRPEQPEFSQWSR